MESRNNNISLLIDRRLNDLQEQFLMLLDAPPQMRQDIENNLCLRISSESKIILETKINDLTEQCLKNDFFSSAKSQNAFWDLRLKDLIKSKYDFNYSIPKLNMCSCYMKWPIISATGTLAIGSVLAFALDSAVILPIAVIIAAAVFFMVKKIIAEKAQSKTKIVAECIEDLKKQLLEWLNAVEIFFNSEINSLRLAGEEK